MAEGTEHARTRITDPQVMRALAHPARIGIIEHLSSTGEGATATEMAGLVGLSPSATSYHLRELAKYGLVEQAPSRGDGRERVWRSTSAGWNLAGDGDQPEVRAAEQELVDVYLSRDFARLRAWFARQHEESTAWRDASGGGRGRCDQRDRGVLRPRDPARLDHGVRAGQRVLDGRHGGRRAALRATAAVRRASGTAGRAA
jgi:DNA-binding transcriptional ArsR family regulator